MTLSRLRESQLTNLRVIINNLKLAEKALKEEDSMTYRQRLMLASRYLDEELL